VTQETTEEVAQSDIHKAEKRIRNAWIAAIVVNLLTLSGIMGWVFGQRLLDVFDVVLVFGLAYGIYKKSGACASAMLFYFVIQKALFMLLAGLPIGILVSAVFVYLFVQGVIGTKDYQEIIQAKQIPEAAGGV